VSNAPTPQRRRGAELEQAILRAAWEELAHTGYAKLTIEGVAARAHTSKTVIYRRWETRARLIVAAMRQEAPNLSAPLPDTGSLRGDVLTLLRKVSANLRKLGPDTVHGLLGELSQLPRLADEIGVRSLGLQVMRTFVARAIERGELRARPISDRLLTLPLDLMRHEVLITHAPLSNASLREIVDDLFLPALHRG
jgi:AcrR family transcriptional regulator